jgi:hypothetical protein
MISVTSWISVVGVAQSVLHKDGTDNMNCLFSGGKRMVRYVADSYHGFFGFRWSFANAAEMSVAQQIFSTPSMSRWSKPQLLYGKTTHAMGKDLSGMGCMLAHSKRREQ